MTNQRVFAAWPTTESRIPVMVDYFAWYPPNDVQMMLALGRQRATTLPDELAARPAGQRVMQLRWLFVYEADIRRYGADPVSILANGYVPVGRTIRMLRPLCNALKRRNLIPDAVWIDTEAGFGLYDMSMDQLVSVFSNPRTRANMPARLRSINPTTDFFVSAPGYQQNIIDFNRWTSAIMTRAIRAALVDSGLFVFNTPNGPYIPPMCRYGGVSPSMPVYDPHGWPLFPTSIDNKTSNPFFYYTGGNRVSNRAHDFRWNLLVDICNWGRSFLRRADSLFWPLITQPITYHNSPWYFEQIIGHLSRLGVTTNNGNGWIFWNEHDSSLGMAGQAQMVYETIARHDQPFPVQRNLPLLELDCDQIETAGFVTTYEEFLNRMGLPTGAGAGTP